MSQAGRMWGSVRRSGDLEFACILTDRRTGAHETVIAFARDVEAIKPAIQRFRRILGLLGYATMKVELSYIRYNLPCCLRD